MHGANPQLQIPLDVTWKRKRLRQFDFLEKKKKQLIHGMESGSKKKKALRVGNSVGVPLAAEAQGLRR